MNKLSRRGLFQPPILLLSLLALVLPALAQDREATINRVAMVGNERGMELRITASQPVTTLTQLVAGPDRFVIDIPNAVPGSQLRGLTLNQGGIRSVRVGLFRSNPPTTRVVLDLNSPGQYQVFPSGNTVIVRLGGTPGLDAPAVVAKNVQPGMTRPAPAQAQPAAPAQAPGLRVDFHDGLLRILAQKATLAEVLYQVQRLTGADIPIPAGAEQEQVVVDAGPGPAKDVIATVLNGTPFNFVVVGSEKDPRALRSVILTPKGADIPQPPPLPPSPDTNAQEVEPVPIPSVEEPVDGTTQQVQPPPMEPGVPDQMAPPTTPPAPPLQPDENTPPPPQDQVPN
jgi:AMIN domain-containing protein